MSIESAKAFIERMKSDQEFAAKITELQSIEEMMRLVASHGYDFTREELLSCSSDLSATDLEHVTGGGGSMCPDLISKASCFLAGISSSYCDPIHR